MSGESLVPEPAYPDEAAGALEVFKSLKMVDAAKIVDPDTGEVRYPTLGEVCESWVFDFVSAIFGAYDRETNRQLITEAFLLISKKNGKSTIAAAIMLTALIRNWRDSQELLLLAPTLEVANNAFFPARDMVLKDETLKDLLHVQEHLKSISHRNTGAILKVVAADSGTVSGKKAGFVLIDELWEFGKRADADGMLREATGGLVARPEGFVIYLSTQSDKEPAGVFKAKLQYARDVRDGKVDDGAFLPVLYEFPESILAKKGYLDPKNFYMTNPNLGRSVRQDWLTRELAKVKEAQGGELQVFLAKHLNVEIGMRLSHDRWRAADYWEAAADPSLTLEELIQRSEVATIGLDGGGLDDLLGISVIGREAKTRRWLSWSHAIAHPKVLKLRKEIAPNLQDFDREGTLTFCEISDDMAALAYIVDQVKKANILPDVDAVGYDPANISDVIETLIKIGISEKQRRKVLQGRHLTPAINVIPRKLLDGTLAHDGSAMMAWCVGNAKVEPRGNDLMITKQVSGRAKIDPVMSLLNAAILMSWNPEPARKPEPELIIL